MATFEASLVSVTYQSAAQPTFSEICDLKWTSLVLLDELGSPGMCTLGVPTDSIEPVGKARLLDLTATPCELWIRRTTSATATSVVFAGPVTACQIQGRTLTIAAPGLLNYLAYWLRDTDYTASSVDQATIVQSLADTWQALAYGHRGIITTALTATGVTRDLTLLGRDAKFILPVIQEMGGRNNGFDLTINPATRALTMWSPRKGTDLRTSVFLDARSIGVPNVSWTVAPGTVGSEVFATSNSTNGATLTSTQSNTTLRATFGRSYITKSYSDISVQATLDDHASRVVGDMASQMYTFAPELLPVTGFAYGDFTTGDQITYDYDAGLGQQTVVVRVATVEMTATSGREMLRVGIL